MKAPKAPSKKQSDPGWPAWIRWLLVGSGRYITFPALVAVALALVCYVAWQRVRERVVAGPQYQVTRESIKLLNIPPWIHSRVSDEVLDQMSLEGSVSLLDDRLAERIAKSFSLHPWIKRVIRVEKRFPAQVLVEVEFRRPVCMVEVPLTGDELADPEDPTFAPGDVRTKAAGGLYPVDEHGVLLPTPDFSPAQARRYPRLSDIHTLPMGPVGASWGDPRVAGAAEIAAVIVDDWERLRLHRIVPSEQPQSGGSSEDFTFEFVTRDGTRVLWGQRPSSTFPGEVSAAEKLRRLRDHLSQAPAEGRPRTEPLEIDIRYPSGVTASARVAKGKPQSNSK
jgi:hypothetical protein